MIRSLKLTGGVVVVLFIALFVSTSVVQVLAAPALTNDDRNVRNLFESFSAERGPIFAGNELVARSTPVDTQYRYLREYPHPELYAPVVGYYTLTQGNAGIESELNPFLTGQSNQQFLDQLNSLVTGTTPTGATVVLSLDHELQQVAFDALAGRSGSVVAIEPSTGRILAMVSTPSFDPNQLASHSTTDVLEAYRALEADSNQPLANKAIAGDQYFPGSVFKVLVTAAALESQSFVSGSQFPNPPELQLPLSNSIVTNSGGRLCGPDEEVSLETALIQSCNIPFAELGLALGEGTIGSMADDFGFEATLEIPMPVTPSRYPRGMDQAQLMLSSFGQYDVRVTPLQVAMMSAAIANEGELMTPHIVDTVLADDLEALRETEPSVYSTPLSGRTARELQRMLIRAVDDGVANQASIPGVDVAGKTGTAETGIGDGRYFWFTGFTPADQGDIAVAVVVEGVAADGTGNSVAAPVAKAVLEEMVNR
ncbi:peptidoglycan transpeptidase [Pontimonas salivibrio]|uniref:Peptidoglycan transpeptidase n=1 Tax=Pontimonas salivibrio TaxID=1159327 RepID=A0A2L2BNI1_9MICO|nr:penicillin-binding protein 2 [Pontimonas salivibrio]AVG23198.1 peptidoglycan transpeptidase [Pontimonas salivibrio]